jgi:putative protease
MYSGKTASFKPELLAPAGSLESFFAALDNGADAVYAGLREFSARTRARNFTLDEIGRMAATCRAGGRRLYVALNTLVRQDELPGIVRILSGLSEARVDAVIVQDLGVAAIARERFPELALHASTQATIHDALGLRQAAALGFRRAVLARELTLPEIREAAAGAPIETEVFVHGATCFCISGQCLFSSFLGGRSGNRGDCAQPCRRRFKLSGGGDFPFSTLDLCGLAAVPALADAGVACLKIEGRMKPAGYVGAVTAAYRRVLDAPRGHFDDAMREASELLERARGRRTGSGFLVEGVPGALTAPEGGSAVGEPLGIVETADREAFTFVTGVRFHAGDRLRVQPAGGREGRTFTVRNVFVAGREGKTARPGNRVTVPAPFRFAAGDAVFRTEDAQSVASTDAACRRRLDSTPVEGISCNVRLDYEGGELTVSGATDEQVFGMTFPVGPLDAARGAGSADAILARFRETGDSPFALAGFDAGSAEGFFIPPSRLKEIRRAFYEAFGQAVGAKRAAQRDERISQALAALPGGSRGASPGTRTLMLGLGSGDDPDLYDRPGVGGFLVPVEPSAPESVREAAERYSAMPDRVVWRLPFWCPPGESGRVAGAVATLLEAGFRRFEANNPAHFRMLDRNVCRIVAGWRLWATNAAAVLSLAAMGASEVVLSPEDSGDNVRALLEADLPVRRWVTVFAKVPMMVSRIPVRRESESAAVRAGEDAFEISARGGLTILRPATPFAIAERVGELVASGADALVVELDGVDPASRESVIDAVADGRHLDGTNPFNFVRGGRS